MNKTLAGIATALLVLVSTGAAQASNHGLSFGLAPLNPEDVGAHQPTCVASGPDWEWTFEFSEPDLHFVGGVVDIDFTTGPGRRVMLPTSETFAIVTTPGPADLLDGEASYYPAANVPFPEGPVTLDFVSVCAPAQATTTTEATTTTSAPPVLPAVLEAAPAPVRAAQPAFTG